MKVETTKVVVTWQSAVPYSGMICYRPAGTDVQAEKTGETLGKVWVGPENASAKVDAFHLKRGIVINISAHLIFILSLSSAYVYSGNFFE